MSRTEIRLTGFGGQGIILSGYIVGKAAAIHDEKQATFTQSYGPESRGGACSAQVIISDEPVSYPHLIDPSILVVMSQEAYNKYAPALRGDALLIIDQDLVETGEISGDLGSGDGVKLLSVPATRLAEELGRKIVANIVMLGFFAAVISEAVVSVEALREAVRTSVPKGTEELNLKAFQKGYEYGSVISDQRSVIRDG
jgi:2-oxoglutarate ferredoxin oxidoreductase subunit gamma